MSQESKKATEEAEMVPAKAQRTITSKKHVLAANVVATFEDLLDVHEITPLENIYERYEARYVLA